MELEKVVARGGHKTHLKPVGQFKALCGFAPSSPRARLFYRSPKWYKMEGHSNCAECQRKANQ